MTRATPIDENKSLCDGICNALNDWRGDGFATAHQPDELTKLLEEPVRRATARYLAENGAEVPVDIEHIVAEIKGLVCRHSDLNEECTTALQQALRNVATTILNEDEPHEITRVIWAWAGSPPGSPEADEELFEAISEYIQLQANRLLARSEFQRLRKRVEPAELLGNLFEKLRTQKIYQLWPDRDRFFAMTFKALERVLRDMQRRAHRQGRDSRIQVSLSNLRLASGPVDIETWASLNEVLKSIDPEQLQVLQFRVLSGYSVSKTAAEIGKSETTVKRLLFKAKSNLRELIQSRDFPPRG